MRLRCFPTVSGILAATLSLSMAFSVAYRPLYAADMATCENPACAVENPQQRYRFVHTSMSIDITLLAYASDETTAAAAADAAFARIDELDGILSDYRPESELRRLCDRAGDGEWVPVSNDLWRVLRCSAEMATLTDGAFDVTAAPVVRLWRLSRNTRALPNPERMATALKLVGWRQMEFDEPTRSIRLTTPEMRLDVGGIAKGYIVGEALKTLADCGVRSALLSAGGDVGVSDSPPGRPGWILGVAPLTPAQGMNQIRPHLATTDSGNHPNSTSGISYNPYDPGGPDNVSPDDGEMTPNDNLSPDNEAVKNGSDTDHPSHYVVVSHCFAATSGDAFQAVVINGVRHSHILDPRTGRAVTTSYSVSLIGAGGMATDALATTMNVIGPEAGLELLDRYNATLPPDQRIAAHFLWCAPASANTEDQASTPLHHLHNAEWDLQRFVTEPATQ